MRRNNLKSLRRFERLEDRRMMAADTDLDDGVLTIQGTENTDSIYVRVSPTDPTDVRVTITNREINQVLLERDYNLADIDQIIIYGLGNNDIITNATNIDAQLYGGDGIDTLESRGSNNMLDGGTSNHADLLYSGPGNDEMIGGPGNDTFFFHQSLSFGFNLGSDVVNEIASTGIDTDTLDFRVFPGSVNLNLAATVEQIVNTDYLRLRLTSDTGIENVIGTDYVDQIYGNSRDNDIWGGDLAINYIWGRDGNDILRGGNSLDFLFGEGGHDDLYGGYGGDYIYGGAGNDDLFGQEDGDFMFGEGGRDTLDGGAGGDTLDGGYVPTLGAIVRDQLRGGSGADTFVRNRKRLQPSLRHEDMLDFNPAIDAVFDRWHDR
jgi:Ca2+-binding RTX toxin-like protein